VIRTKTKKIIRDSLSQKTRTFFVIFSIFVGVLGTVILSTMGQMLARQIGSDLSPDEMAMLRIYVSSEAGGPIDNDEVFTAVRQEATVTDIEGQAAYEVAWRLPGDTSFRRGDLYAYSQAFSLTDIEPVRLVDGRYPLPERNEVAIERRTALEHDLSVGDNIVLSQNTGLQFSWRVVGIVFQPYLYFGDKSAENNFYATYPDAQTLLGFEGFSSMYIRFEDFNAARSDALNVRKIINEDTPYDIVFHLIDEPEENAMLVGAQRFRNVLLVLAIISTLVASLLVANIVNMIVTEQREEIGTMKALGAVRRDIYFIYLGMILIYGAIATLPAILMGVPFGKFAASEVAPLANTILTDRSTPIESVVLALIMGLVVPVLAAIVPVFLGTRVSILEAINDRGIQAEFGHGVLPHLVRVVPTPMLLTQSLNNFLRRRARLVLTFTSLTLASAAFMGMYATFSSLNSVITDIRDRLDVDLSLDITSIEVKDVIDSFMLDDDADGTLAISPGVAIELKVNESTGEDENAEEEELGFPIVITAVEDLANVKGLEFESASVEVEKADTIIITPQMAERYDKQVGDTIAIRAPLQMKPFEVVGIASYPFETAFMHWETLADFVGDVQDAPTPNDYWEPVVAKKQDSDAVETWALGVNQEVGVYLSDEFSENESGVIITRALAEAGGYSVGDKIAINTSNGNLLNEVDDLVRDEYVFTIVEILDFSSEETALVTRNIPPDVDLSDGIIILFWADLAEAVEFDFQSFYPNTFIVDLADPLSNVEDQAETNVIKPNVLYDNEVGFAERVVQTVISIGVVMNLASMLMALVGGISLLTITLMTVWERQREIGVMRSVGATNKVVFVQFLLEGVMVGLLAWIASVPISYYLAQYLTDSVPFSEVITFSYTPLAPLLGLVGMLIVTVLAVLYPAWRASRRTVSDILRYR
jgi:putative ABC transport system permease protein